MTGLKDQCFGCRSRDDGHHREQAAQALADYFGTVPRYKGGAYEACIDVDENTRTDG